MKSVSLGLAMRKLSCLQVVLTNDGGDSTSHAAQGEVEGLFSKKCRYSMATAQYFECLSMQKRHLKSVAQISTSGDGMRTEEFIFRLTKIEHSFTDDVLIESKEIKLVQAENV